MIIRNVKVGHCAFLFSLLQMFLSKSHPLSSNIRSNIFNEMNREMFETLATILLAAVGCDCVFPIGSLDRIDICPSRESSVWFQSRRGTTNRSSMRIFLPSGRGRSRWAVERSDLEEERMGRSLDCTRNSTSYGRLWEGALSGPSLRGCGVSEKGEGRRRKQKPGLERERWAPADDYGLGRESPFPDDEPTCFSTGVHSDQ